MTALVCGADCAAPTWAVIGLHLAAGAALWLLLLVLGAGLACCSYSCKARCLRTVAERGRRCMEESIFGCLLRVALAVAQSVIIALRTSSQSAPEVGWFIELAVCGVYAVDLLVAWAERNLASPGAGARFLCASLADCLLLPSVALMAVPLQQPKTWFSLSAVALLLLPRHLRRLLVLCGANFQALGVRTVDVAVRTASAVLLATLGMMTVESLEDPEALRQFNTDEWNMISSLYYVVSTVSTVGYPGLAPQTLLGRCFAIVTVFGGISFMLVALQEVNQVIALQSSGLGSFEPRPGHRHVLVSGNLTLETAKDFILELLHPDHAKDADDLHVVLLLPQGSGVAEAVALFAMQAPSRIAGRIHVFQGTVLRDLDLERVSARRAQAFFLLPNMQSSAPLEEDTENIMRTMAVRRCSPSARVILVLFKAESRQLLTLSSAVEDPGLACVALDEIRMGLAGKTCEVTGFSPLICNLVKCVGHEKAQQEDTDAQECWQEEYECGLGHEIYEIPLSQQYGAQDAVFFQAVRDVLERTGGIVYLVGLVEIADRVKRVLVNPGALYRIRRHGEGVFTCGIFIAPNRDSILQCRDHQKLLCGDTPPGEGAPTWATVIESLPPPDIFRSDGSPKAASLPLPQVDLDPALVGELTGEPRKTVKQLVGLMQREYQARQPPKPPLQMLVQGGHVLMLCTGMTEGEELRLGIGHFVRPLRQSSGQKGATAGAPIVVVAPTLPRDWENVSHYRHVYFLRGSPLSDFDVERANVRGAAAVFICNVGARCNPEGGPAESWRVDAEAIYCCRLVESLLPQGSRVPVVTELAAESNHLFLPIPSSASAAPSHPGEAVRLRSKMGLPAVTSGPHPRGLRGRDCCRQARYASGQLFVGGMITSLAANVFYSPSLYDLVSKMIAAHVTMLKVPPPWVGKPYVDFFDHLLWEQNLLAIGMFRTAQVRLGGVQNRELSTSQLVNGRSPEGDIRGKSHQYVYTAPPAWDTKILESDCIICFNVTWPS